MLDYASALERDVFPALGARPADDITADQFARVLEKIEDRSAHAAHKARSGLGSTYTWAQRRRLVTVNPVKGLAFTHQSERRKRILTDAEMVLLWHGIALAGQMGVVTEPVCNIVRLAILTGQRNSEVAGMATAELKGLDTSTPRWDIPAERMKRKSDDQFVPLTKQVVAIVNASLASDNQRHVFPGTTHGRTGGTWLQEHIGQETVSRAMARITKVAGLKDVHLHDMRKCVTSWLAEHGHATPEVLDAILHHGRRGVTGTHYNFALYEGQVRKALSIWADHIERITSAPARVGTGNVVKLRA
jgi:integrase